MNKIDVHRSGIYPPFIAASAGICNELGPYRRRLL